MDGDLVENEIIEKDIEWTNVDKLKISDIECTNAADSSKTKDTQHTNSDLIENKYIECTNADLSKNKDI